MDETTALERQIGRVLDDMGGPAPIFDAMAVAHAAVATPATRWRLPSRMRAAMVSGPIAALVGGVLLAVIVVQPPDQANAPGAESSASVAPAETAPPYSTTAFAVPFSYAIPDALSSAGFFEDDEAVAFAIGSDPGGSHFGQTGSGTSDARGVLVVDMTDATVNPPCPMVDGAHSQVPLPSDPARLLDDLRNVGGLHLDDQADTTLGGRPAIMVRSQGSDCDNGDIHLWHSLTWVRLVIPSRIIVAEVEGKTLMAQIWARTDDDLETWLPVGQTFLDSIEFHHRPGDGLGPGPVPADHGTFTPGGLLPSGRWTAGLFALPDGRAVAIGLPWGTGATAEVWDPATKAFTPAGSLPESHEFGGSAMLSDGRVLVAGGLRSISSEGPTDTAAIWDPSTNEFEPTGSLVTALLSPHTVTLPDDRVLVVEGTATPQLWDPVAGGFTEMDIAGRFCGARLTALDREMDTLGSATLLPDGRVLMLGQVMEGLGSLRPCVEVWDVDAGTATELDLGVVDGSPDTATVLADGRVVVFVADQDGMEAILWKPATGESIPAGALPGKTSGFRPVLLTDGRVLVAGGFDHGGDPLASAELWDPATLAFEPTDGLDEARGDALVALLQDGRVLVAGGHYSSAAIAGGPSTTEIFALRGPIG